MRLFYLTERLSHLTQHALGKQARRHFGGRESFYETCGSFYADFVRSATKEAFVLGNETINDTLGIGGFDVYFTGTAIHDRQTIHFLRLCPCHRSDYKFLLFDNARRYGIKGRHTCLIILWPTKTKDTKGKECCAGSKQEIAKIAVVIGSHGRRI